VDDEAMVSRVDREVLLNEAVTDGIDSDSLAALFTSCSMTSGKGIAAAEAMEAQMDADNK